VSDETNQPPEQPGSPSWAASNESEPLTPIPVEGDATAPNPVQPAAPAGGAEVPPTAPGGAVPPTPPPGAWPAAQPGWTPPPSRASARVGVPAWVLFVVAGVALLGIGFAAGWIAAPGGDHHDRAVMPNFRQMGPGSGPGVGPGNGDGNGNGDGFGIPSNPRGNGAYLGVTIQNAPDDAGARVVSVLSGSPADDAGLKAGDVITKLDGDGVANASQLTEAVGSHDPGDKVSVTYQRDGETKTVDVELKARSTARTGPSRSNGDEF
jgi:hypothetical protein